MNEKLTLVTGSAGRIGRAVVRELRSRDHPVRGFVPPVDFIALAEETGLIVSIGEWVLRQACSDAAKWPREMRVAINLSPIQFRR